MNLRACMILAKREVQDMLTDWRIMIPVSLLTFVLPLMLLSVSGFVIKFVDDANLAARLLPFVILLVGFIPASFSLITALESFVGERERNSLEALLALPISDDDLYLSKLFSSLVPPLLSSYTAMLIFTALFYFFDPITYLTAIDLSRLLLLFLSIGFLALIMVAGAVVISSHIATIRTANLMSSFILLPIMVVVQTQGFLIINEHWDGLWVVAGGLGAGIAVLIRAGMKLFKREEILSREHQRTIDIPWSAIFTPQQKPQLQAKDHSWGKSPILIIFKRELQETLSDWRILIPFALLTFVLPLGLVAGTDFAISFVKDLRNLARLVPFALLLIGFIPSSFALITALESFVGERERNTLEVLLAMPISDKEIYLSKLFSALIPPLITSISAMLTFALALALTHPQLYLFAMDPATLWQLLIMIAVMNLTMVTGAVVISSHTGSIRAANLLASFILLPLSAFIQLQAILIIANLYSMIWFSIAILGVIALILMRTGLATFNREEILSREHDQISLREVIGTFWQFFYSYQPAGVGSEAYQDRKFSLKRFYQQDLPALLHDLRIPLILILLGVLGTTAVGAFRGSDLSYSIRGMRDVLKQIGNFPEPSLLLALSVFVRNLRVTLLSNVLSAFSFGLISFTVPTFAFFQFSFISARMAALGGSWVALGPQSPLQFLLGYVLPHGIIELPTSILSGALGLRIGVALLPPPKGFTVGQHLLWALANFLKIWLFVLLPLLFISAMVEGLITPRILQMLYRP